MNNGRKEFVNFRIIIFVGIVEVKSAEIVIATISEEYYLSSHV